MLKFNSRPANTKIRFQLQQMQKENSSTPLFDQVDHFY